MNRLATLLRLALALVLAFGLWAYVSFTTNPLVEQSYTITLDPINIPATLMLVDPTTNQPLLRQISIDFRARGPQATLNSLQALNFRAQLDLQGLASGDHTLPVVIAGPSAARVVATTPATVTLRLDEVITRSVSVTVARRGQVPFLYTLGPLQQSLITTTVRGPSRLVNTVRAASSLVSVADRTVNLQENLVLQPVNADGALVEGVTLSPGVVAVTATITPRVEGQLVSILPSVEGLPAAGFRLRSVDWEPRIVKVLTTRVITGTLPTEVLDIAGLTSNITGTLRLAPNANVITDPPGITITVRVTLEAINVPSLLARQLIVSVVNLGEGLVATAEPSVISVVLRGPYEQLRDLVPGVAATVDVGGLGAGVYTLPVVVAVPIELTQVEPLAEEVVVTIGAVSVPTPLLSTPTSPAMDVLP